MRNAIQRPGRDLYWTNVQMVLLCALTSFWLLVSPLVPYVFDTKSIVGMALFVSAQLVLTIALAWVGVTLNRLAAYEKRVTLQTVRAALRRARRRG